MPQSAELKNRLLELKARRERTRTRSSDDLKAFDAYWRSAEVELNRIGSGWISSAETERIWLLLHDAEEELDLLEPDVSYLMNAAITHGLADLNGRFTLLEKRITATSSDDEKRAWARQVIHEAHAAAAGRHVSERNESKGVIIFSLAFCLGLLALATAQILVGNVSLVPAPSDKSLDGLPFMFVIMLSGALGGLLTGFITFYPPAPRFRNTRWHDPRPAAMLAKAALGALMAFFGTILVGTGILGVPYRDVPSALLIALLFGFGQIAVTQFLNKRVKSILEGEKKP